jgi:hypothetical protein
MANTCESLINAVTRDKRKMLRGHTKANTLEPKGKGSGLGALNSPGVDGAPPAERRSLSHALWYLRATW